MSQETKEVLNQSVCVLRLLCEETLLNCASISSTLESFKNTSKQESVNIVMSHSPATIIREFKTLSAIFHWAIGHGFMVSNPLKGVRLPKEPPHRERIASEEDIEKLLIACAWDGISPPTTDTQTVIAAFLFSCRTGMRAGEILQLEESWIEGKVIHLPATVTKTQHRRDVALGKEAMRILNLVRKANGEDLFKMDSEVRATIFRKIRERRCRRFPWKCY